LNLLRLGRTPVALQPQRTLIAATPLRAVADILTWRCARPPPPRGLLAGIFYLDHFLTCRALPKTTIEQVGRTRAGLAPRLACTLSPTRARYPPPAHPHTAAAGLPPPPPPHAAWPSSGFRRRTVGRLQALHARRARRFPFALQPLLGPHWTTNLLPCSTTLLPAPATLQPMLHTHLHTHTHTHTVHFMDGPDE